LLERSRQWGGGNILEGMIKKIITEKYLSVYISSIGDFEVLLSRVGSYLRAEGIKASFLVILLSGGWYGSLTWL